MVIADVSLVEWENRDRCAGRWNSAEVVFDASAWSRSVADAAVGHGKTGLG